MGFQNFALKIKFQKDQKNQVVVLAYFENKAYFSNFNLNEKIQNKAEGKNFVFIFKNLNLTVCVVSYDLLVEAIDQKKFLRKVGVKIQKIFFFSIFDMVVFSNVSSSSEYDPEFQNWLARQDFEKSENVLWKNFENFEKRAFLFQKIVIKDELIQEKFKMNWNKN